MSTLTLERAERVIRELLAALEGAREFLEGFDDADYEREFDDESIVRPMIERVDAAIANARHHLNERAEAGSLAVELRLRAGD